VCTCIFDVIGLRPIWTQAHYYYGSNLPSDLFSSDRQFHFYMDEKMQEFNRNHQQHKAALKMFILVKTVMYSLWLP
jgi:hypothetical protein